MAEPTLLSVAEVSFAYGGAGKTATPAVHPARDMDPSHDTDPFHETGTVTTGAGTARDIAPAPIGADTASLARTASTPVLYRLSFDVRRGDLLCILGPSGCGKSTLIQLVAGFLSPTEGSITMNGSRVTGPGTDRALVPQQTTLYPWLNVVQNVALPLKVQGVAAAERMRRAEEALAMVGLAHVARERPEHLSGGMQQRVMVARALVQNAQVLLMDEPFGGLDALTREKLQLELLKVWRETGVTIMLITHDVDEAVALATRALVMGAAPGRIVASLELDFSRRLASDAAAISDLRSNPAFVEARRTLREHLGV